MSRQTAELLERIKRGIGQLSDRVGVAGPQSESAGGVMVRDVSRAMDVLTTAGIPTNRADGCFMKLHKRVQALAEERDQLRAELQAAQVDRDLAREQLTAAGVAQRELLSAIDGWREQHEALRAAATQLASNFERWGRNNASHAEMCHPEDAPKSKGRAAAFSDCAAHLRRLLKPATPEAQSAPKLSEVWGSAKETHGGAPVDPWINASPADALRPNDRHAQRPANEDPLPSVTYPAIPIEPAADAEMDRLVRERSTGERRPLAHASLTLLMARVERIDAALRCYLDGLLGAYVMGDVEMRVTHEALAMLDARKQEVGK